MHGCFRLVNGFDFVARKQLRGFEQIKGVILEPELFELSEKELVTATLKKRRDRLLKHYKVMN